MAGGLAIKTRKAVVRLPSPIGPIPRLFICSYICASHAFSFSSSDRKRVLLARRAEPSNVLPTPSRTIIGGHGLPPLSHTVLSTNEATSCAGSSIAKALTYSEAAPLTSTVTDSSSPSQKLYKASKSGLSELTLVIGSSACCLNGTKSVAHRTAVASASLRLKSMLVSRPISKEKIAMPVS